MTTDITELAQSLKAAAEKASNGDWVKESGAGWEACCSANDQANGGFIIAHFVGPDAAENREFVQAANPANVLALVEALEYYKSREERVTSLVRDNSKSWDELYRQVEAKGIRNVELVEALEKAQQRIAELESRTVKLPDELSWETLLDVASRTDLVYSDDTGILEYTNINECVVKVTAPPDKVIRLRCSNKLIYMRLVDRVKTHEHAGIIIHFPKNYKDFIQ